MWLKLWTEKQSKILSAKFIFHQLNLCGGVYQNFFMSRLDSCVDSVSSLTL